MRDIRSFTLSTALVIATILVTSLLLSRLASALTTDIESTATTERVALYVTLCLWSKERPTAMCREVPLTPGAAGPEFVNMKACLDGQEEAMRKWFSEAGPVFGFTDVAGDGYRIDGRHCRPVAGSSSGGE
jgi:hypothetical protein